MENSFGDILNECSAELDNYGVKNKTSAALILAFFKYDNSVFNEIYDSISYYDILILFTKENRPMAYLSNRIFGDFAHTLLDLFHCTCNFQEFSL